MAPKTKCQDSPLDGRLAQSAVLGQGQRGCASPPTRLQGGTVRTGHGQSQVLSSRAPHTAVCHVSLAGRLRGNRPPAGPGPWATMCPPAWVINLSEGEGSPLDTRAKLRRSREFTRKARVLVPLHPALALLNAQSSPLGNVRLLLTCLAHLTSRSHLPCWAPRYQPELLIRVTPAGCAPGASSQWAGNMQDIRHGWQRLQVQPFTNV